MHWKFLIKYGSRVLSYKDTLTFNKRKQGKEPKEDKTHLMGSLSKAYDMCYHWVGTFLSNVFTYDIIFLAWKDLYKDMIFKHIPCSQKSKRLEEDNISQVICHLVTFMRSWFEWCYRFPLLNSSLSVWSENQVKQYKHKLDLLYTEWYFVMLLDWILYGES